VRHGSSTGEQVEEVCSAGKDENQEKDTGDEYAFFYAGEWSFHESVPDFEVYEEKTAAAGPGHCVVNMDPAGLSAPGAFCGCCNNQVFFEIYLLSREYRVI
jgi:hypothetical protein